jgi:hypothetical protein
MDPALLRRPAGCDVISSDAPENVQKYTLCCINGSGKYFKKKIHPAAPYAM